MNVLPYTSLNGLFPAICCVWLRPISMPCKPLFRDADPMWRWLYFSYTTSSTPSGHTKRQCILVIIASALGTYQNNGIEGSTFTADKHYREIHQHSLVKHMYNYVYIMYNIYMRVWVRGVWGKYVLLLSSIWCIYNAFSIYIMHLNHLPLDKMAIFWQTTFSNAFHWMKLLAFRFNIHCNLFLRVPLTMNQQWFR